MRQNPVSFYGGKQKVNDNESSLKLKSNLITFCGAENTKVDASHRNKKGAPNLIYLILQERKD